MIFGSKVSTSRDVGDLSQNPLITSGF
jgi:hypothetical protein